MSATPARPACLHPRWATPPLFLHHWPISFPALCAASIPTGTVPIMGAEPFRACIKQRPMRLGRAVARATDTSDYARTARREVCNATNAVSLTAIDRARASSARILSATASKRKASQSRAIAKGKPKVSWKRTYQHAAFTYRGPFTTCKMRHVAAFRVRGKWGGWQGQQVRQPTLNVNATGGEGPRERATTAMSTWGGMPAASIFLEVASLEENPAIRAALFSGERWRQQAIDSVTASNIAIMVLSLLLALVPIALFADVSAIVAFAYALVTDVGSCLPLAIKGIELIQLS
eukprot:IDg14934t1